MSNSIPLKNIIEKIQCPGCVSGSDTTCGAYKKKDYSSACESHRAGTLILGSGSIYLGMPKGFNKVGSLPSHISNNIDIFEKINKDTFDIFNLPIWALEDDGLLFVRVFSPRVADNRIYVFESGLIADINIKSQGSALGDLESNSSDFKAIDISSFQSKID